MTTIKQLLILAFSLILFQSAFAADAKVSLEPIYGMETSLVRFPEPARYVTRATYGVRALYGVTLFSGEAEYTTAVSKMDYPSTFTKVEDKVERLGAGFRSTFPFNPYLGVYLRAGGRATRGETIVTTSGVSETKDNPLHIDPYAGSGVVFAFGSNIGANAGVTMIRNAEGKYDVQYTLGLSARFGKL